MVFQEPKVVLVKIEMTEIIGTSGCDQLTDQCPDVVSHEKPAVQTCSTGAFQDQDCDVPVQLW